MKLPETPKNLKIKKTQQPRFMFYSELAAHLYGYYTAFVPGGGDERREVRYTGVATDGKFDEYKWPDKHLVWQGNDSDIKFVGEKKPWRKEVIPPKHAPLK